MTNPSSQLTGEQYKQLQNALVSAFPNLDAFRQMVRIQLDKNLDALAGNDTLNQVVFRLIDAAEAEGWTKILVDKAYQHNPGNADLHLFAQQFLPSGTVRDETIPSTQVFPETKLPNSQLRKRIFTAGIVAGIVLIVVAMSVVLYKAQTSNAQGELKILCIENIDPEYTYSKVAKKKGLTNYSDVINILGEASVKKGNVNTYNVSPSFTDYGDIVEKNPTIIIMHASAFDVPQRPQATIRIQDFFQKMADQSDLKAFIIYGRSIPKEPDQQQGWWSTIATSTAEKLRGKTHLIPISVREYPDNPFEDPQNRRLFQAAIEPYLKHKKGG